MSHVGWMEPRLIREIRIGLSKVTEDSHTDLSLSLLQADYMSRAGPVEGLALSAEMAV